MLKIIEKQFRQPEGFIGKIISKLMKKANTKVYNKLIHILDINNNDKIFEIGYGHGLGIEKISSMYDCFISGIDFSKLMYTETLKRSKGKIDKEKVKLFYGDFLQYDLDMNTYDKIFCLNVIYFWENLEIPFFKIKNGLKKDGAFCLFAEHPDELSKQGFTKKEIFNKYDIEFIVDQLKKSGFNHIEYHFEKGYYIQCKN